MVIAAAAAAAAEAAAAARSAPVGVPCADGLCCCNNQNNIKKTRNNGFDLPEPNLASQHCNSQLSVHYCNFTSVRASSLFCITISMHAHAHRMQFCCHGRSSMPLHVQSYCLLPLLW
jgi:hypothetical protein